MRGVGCKCLSNMGAETSIWTTYKPGAVYSLLVDKWEISLPLPRALAVVALGKWVYYLERGKFPDSPAGRLAASDAIAADMLRESGIRPATSAVYSLLQNANAYLLKELTLPQSERGLMSVTAWTARKLKRGAAETGARVSETGEKIRDTFTPPKWLFSPWTLGGLGLLLAAGAISNYIPIRRR